jgi:hypothetical protein
MTQKQIIENWQHEQTIHYLSLWQTFCENPEGDHILPETRKMHVMNWTAFILSLVIDEFNRRNFGGYRTDNKPYIEPQMI